MAWPEDMKAVG